jgi:alpha-galactosidase
MPAIASVTAGPYTVAVEGDPGPFAISLSHDSPTAGVYHVHLRMRSDRPSRPPKLRLVWSHPLVETHLKWFPGCGTDRTVLPEWRSSRICRSRNTSDAPVYSLFSSSGRNCLTFALSDATNAVTLAAGVVEETADVKCEVSLFAEPFPPITEYEATLRLDTRPVPYYRALAAASDWWASMKDAAPSHVPEHARLPMYSSWYSLHQRLSPEAIEHQCKLARPLGMESVIVDDGWQTDDNSRGYAYCGDWEVAPAKLPAFAAHVARVHDIGMKYILWFSVPFVGIHSKAYRRFKDKILNPAATEGWFVLDPRFQDVREYLVSLYETFARKYSVDGFKLDFVDTFELSREMRDSLGNGRDIDSVPAAVDALLTDTMKRLRAINPDVLVEFRQSYIGPLMRKYGNMFRAGDVPGDYHGNRVKTIDVRLLSGSTPAHSDMVMWNAGDSVESAAMQLVHTLFAVPQVSVLLDAVPKEHVEMLRFYLAFWRLHRDVLLDGALEPDDPGMLYPSVSARTSTKLLAALYGGGCLSLRAPLPGTIILVNGTFSRKLAFDLAENAGKRNVTITSCTGSVLHRETLKLPAGLHSIDVPPAGVAVLES